MSIIASFLVLLDFIKKDLKHLYIGFTRIFWFKTDVFEKNYALVFKILFPVNVRIKMLFKSEINFPERFAFFYYLIKVFFGTANKGI